MPYTGVLILYKSCQTGKIYKEMYTKYKTPQTKDELRMFNLLHEFKFLSSVTSFQNITIWWLVILLHTCETCGLNLSLRLAIQTEVFCGIPQSQ